MTQTLQKSAMFLPHISSSVRLGAHHLQEVQW